MSPLAAGLVAVVLAQPATPAPAVFTGTVALRPGPAGKPAVAVLVTADGRELPLVRDDEARKFFLDEALRGRPVRFTGRLSADTGKLTVAKARVVINGRPHEIDYWCENCRLSFNDPGRCWCCGGETVRRETPAD